MLSSNSSSCNPNYAENDITSFTSKSVDPNFFFNFPTSPHMHLEYEDVVYLDNILAADWSGNIMALDGVSLAAEHQPSAARRSLKKDRHSKINTARGPRDRRMRLSLDIARRFFDLQDLLGYDKASRTVDWLLKNSRSAIRDLQRGSSRESCTSEDGGEAASSSITAAAAASSNRKLVGKRGVRVQVQQKRATVARESRRKARERARERTSQKGRLMREKTAQKHVSGESTEGVLCQWNSFDFQNNINHEFLHQDEQIAEFQFNGKAWEGSNNFN